MRYKQMSSHERCSMARLFQAGLSLRRVAAILERSPSTISRERRRNRCRDGYRWTKADLRARTRKRTSRRNKRFDPGVLHLVDERLRKNWSPEQVAGTLSREGRLSISHQTIYTHVWNDRARGGTLHRHLRCSRKRRRKRYGARDSRGRLQGKRMIDERPAEIELRNTIGHWEIDTVLGRGSNHCILTMVERATGFTLIGKLRSRTTNEVQACIERLMALHTGRIVTITADNGTEFHGYQAIEDVTGVIFYFAHPHHSWERGTNENTNGLIRQYLPKGQNMRTLTQEKCDLIAQQLNDRPRKRFEYQTPSQRYQQVA